jgi:hypothetical protein
MNRQILLAIVDAHSGGLKGLELMTMAIVQLGTEAVNQMTFLDEVEALINKEIPELGFLRYVCKISEDTFREKVFIYRKELDCRFAS